MQSLNIRTKPALIENKLIQNKLLKQEDLGAKLLKRFVGPDSWTLFLIAAALEGTDIRNKESLKAFK